MDLPDVNVQSAQQLHEGISTAVRNTLNNSDFIQSISESVANVVLQNVRPDIENRLNILENRVTVVENNTNFQLDFVQQHLKRNSIRVYGVPETPNEIIEDVVLNLINNAIGIANIGISAICRAHRIGFKNPNSNWIRPIFVEFTSYKYKNIVYGNKRNLRHSGYYMTEELTQRRARHVKRLNERHGRRNVWTEDGKIFVKNAEGKPTPVDLNEIHDF